MCFNLFKLLQFIIMFQFRVMLPIELVELSAQLGMLMILID